MKQRKENKFRNPIYLIETKFLKLYLLVGFILRIALMLSTPRDATFTIGETMRLLGMGILSDAGMGILLFIPLQVVYITLNEWKYTKPIGWCIEALLLLFLGYLLFFHSIFDEYGGAASDIAKIFVSWKLLSFTLRFFLPKIRNRWRNITLYATWGIYVFLFFCITAGEFMFWKEFGVRYNFIAVDYLVYTNEVIGNILESYSIMPLLSLILLMTIGVIFYGTRKFRFRLTQLYTPRLLTIHLSIYGIVAILSYYVLSVTHHLESDNQYVTQLEQNGACDFIIAFQSNKLDYAQFYAMLPKIQATRLYHKEAGFDNKNMKMIGDSADTTHPNIVLITVESLSADFLTRYGNQQGLTPHLDTLMQKSMVFDHLYAVGNRTVRGLEALSLCIPPSAGESIIKRKANKMGNLSIGSLLGNMGYKCQFLYGGDSYFDNMGDFFSHNGYQVIDRKDIANKDVTFSNIWGVCDEDIFQKALDTFDKNAAEKKPFFAQVMTTSNHRPYTYPAKRIKVEGDPHTREAAVMYTDYAIGKFLSEASRKSWYKNTVFVIIADHCASSAGKTSIPIDCYHIPCILYAPSLIKPQVVDKVCSQIDIMPTVLSLCHLKSKVEFTGVDILNATYQPRAFMATYQDLGYLEANTLTVLSPIRQIRQYAIENNADGTHTETPIKSMRRELIKKAQAYYQFANLYQKAQ